MGVVIALYDMVVVFIYCERRLLLWIFAGKTFRKMAFHEFLIIKKKPPVNVIKCIFNANHTYFIFSSL